MQRTHPTERKPRKNDTGTLPPFAMFSTLPFAAGANPAHAASKIVGEWFDFVHRRVDQDFRLLQRLSESRAPGDFLKAYSDFWQLAAQDYWNECVGMSKLVGNLAHAGAEDAQDAPKGSSQETPLHHAA